MVNISENKKSEQLTSLYFYMTANGYTTDTSVARILYARFLAFIEEYGHNYKKEALLKIIERFPSSIIDLNYTDAEIYSHIGLTMEKDDSYKAFAKIIDDIHGVSGKNILDIGAGPFPRLSEIISIKQNGCGTITAYDPDLVTDYLHDIRLVKKSFTNIALLNNYDLVVAMLPCKATPIVLRSKRFTLALCNCIGFNESEESKFNYDYRNWVNYVISLAEESCDSDSMITVSHIDQLGSRPIISKIKKV